LSGRRCERTREQRATVAALAGAFEHASERRHSEGLFHVRQHVIQALVQRAEPNMQRVFERARFDATDRVDCVDDVEDGDAVGLACQGESAARPAK
jgi:hypothetical protein